MARAAMPFWNVYIVTVTASGVAAAIHLAIAGPTPWVLATMMLTIMLTHLAFTLAEHRRSKLSGATAQAIIRTPRLIELAVAEAQLLSMRTAYKASRISGHPEDTLWDIEDAEKRVARLRAGTD